MTTAEQRFDYHGNPIPANYKWIALSNTTLGVLIATINASILLISLPDIFKGIHINPLLPSNTNYLLWLILGFFNAAGLMLLTGAEFIAMLLVIVYVGAVAVLFLFVVMMLDIDFAAMRAGFSRNAPLGLAIAAVLLAELHGAVVDC